ncbi:MAG: carboxylating nicotinate-nucleotide diphosphorylase [Pseudanabaenaceae cyanobacterium SKYGB_i_bin29]|nr:carboxylating nicotinate-nucleotide diphosphorylase [Pseudanabaenaceae cyanobacterium SKYG29]MDW8421270.1 carboxylating nicotinate-nucleotide diphosphorylase [Pseudanabaenaceae cyanobacterium SKYGB_i_bin29]
MLPPPPLLDRLILEWLAEDIGFADRTTQALKFPEAVHVAKWLLKGEGVVCGLGIAQRVFQLLDPNSRFIIACQEGQWLEQGKILCTIEGKTAALLMGERVALNCVMRLSGISTTTYLLAQEIRDFSAQLVDTRKTTPGLRALEKYAVLVGGGKNHRSRLDEAVIIKDNHIRAVGSITQAVYQVRQKLPITTVIEVETETLDQVEEALALEVDIIMLDNMNLASMRTAVEMIRRAAPHTKIEVSGNITLDNIRSVAELGVDYISTSAMMSRSHWLDISMKFL